MRQLSPHPARLRTGHGRAASRGQRAEAPGGAPGLPAVPGDGSHAAATVRPPAGSLLPPPRVAHRSCLIPIANKRARVVSTTPEDGPNTRFVLTIRAAGGAAGEIASALIASGAEAPPAVRATAVSPAAPLRARTAAQAQHVSRNARLGGPVSHFVATTPLVPMESYRELQPTTYTSNQAVLCSGLVSARALGL